MLITSEYDESCLAQGQREMFKFLCPGVGPHIVRRDSSAFDVLPGLIVERIGCELPQSERIAEALRSKIASGVGTIESVYSLLELLEERTSFVHPPRHP
jgi:hypothetical protein